MTTRYQFASLLAFAFLANATIALSFPVQIRHQDDPTHCDELFIPFDADELGLGSVFPADETIDYFSPGASLVSPCPDGDSPDIENVEIVMFNATGRDFQEVWYAADDETTLSNFDGYANQLSFPTNPGFPAFRIDHQVSDPGGVNHPLIFESLSVDGIWQAGEEWRFVIQDYANLAGLPADAFTSIGVGEGSVDVAGAVPSSGSIIAIPVVPEPTSLVLFSLGIVAVVTKRR